MGMPKGYKRGPIPPKWERPARDIAHVNYDRITGSLPPMLTRKAVAAGAYDADALTISATVATSTPVLRRDAKGVFAEILDPAGLRMPSDSLPFVDSHNLATARAAIGITRNFRLEGETVVADLRFSLADDVTPIRQRVEDGTLSSFSVGYRVFQWTESVVDGVRTRTATDWTIHEVSLVAIPADPKAQLKRNSNMETTEEITIAPEAEQQQIRSLAELAGLTRGWAEDQIDAGASLESARAAALEEMRSRQQQTPRIRVVASHDDPQQVRARQEDALMFRAVGGDLPDASRPFAEIGFRQLAVDSLARAGVSTRGLSSDEIFQRAAQHTTSDFALTVSNVAGRIAQERYRAAASALMPLVRTRNLPNFKPSSTVRLGEIGTLKEISESGEITHVTHGETGESYQLSTYAGALNLSRRLLIDDDLNLFGDTTAALADAAAVTVADKLAATLVGGTALKLSDGKAVFHASRGNLPGTGEELAVDTLDDARKALRPLKGVDGQTIVGATPKFLVVGPDLETEAETILTQIQATAIADVNPFGGKLSLLVEPRLEGRKWFVFADPARLPTLVLAYLSSAPGPQIQRTEGWDVLGMRFRVVLDFGTAWTDWRGAYLNPGA